MKILQILLTQMVVIGFLILIRDNPIPAWMDTILIIVSVSFGATSFLEDKNEKPATQPTEDVEEEEEVTEPPRPLKPDVVCPECFGAGYRLVYRSGIQQQETCQTCRGRREIPEAQAKAYEASHAGR